MRKTFGKFLLLASLALIACNSKEEILVIDGSVVGIPEDSYVYLKNNKPKTLQLVTVDSTQVKGGKFKFNLKVDNLDERYLQFADQKKLVTVITEVGIVKVDYNFESLKLLSISGTYNNDKYLEYTNQANTLISKINDFEVTNAPKLIKAQKDNNSTLLNAINQENQKLKQAYVNYNKTFVEENKTAYISLILLEQLTSNGDFNFEEGKAIFNQFSADLLNSSLGKELSAYFNPEITLVDTSIGAKFPDLVAKNLDNKETSIYTKLGKITLVDFWASWCPPCRAENPNLVKIHDEFNSKGFEIIGFSLDKNKESWEKAISKDKLSWTQLSNLKEWKDPVVKRLGIEEIPTSYLLDENGKIIAKNLTAIELKKKLQEILK